MPKIFFGVPIRNRSWILPEYLKGFLSLNYPKSLITAFFLVNDSEDDTLIQLVDFKTKYKDRYNGIYITNQVWGMPEGDRNSITIRLYSHYAKLKNYVKEKFKESGCNYWLQIDSDSPCKPDTLEKLLRHRKEYVCGICNVSRQEKQLSNVMTLQGAEIIRATFEELKAVPAGQLFEAEWVGGIALIKWSVAISCEYKVIDPRRDDTFGFCQDIKMLGKKVFVDPEVELKHYMSKKEYLKDENKNKRYYDNENMV